MKTQLSEADVAKAMGWPLDQVRSYVAAGVADGYFKSTPLGLQFDPAFPEFLRWYVARLDDALAYRLDPSDLGRMASRKREELAETFGRQAARGKARQSDVPLDVIRRALARSAE